ncbi:MAG: HAMP domain-containing sensor histidine kinase [bacterium]|nr:HAMP domain-containing sensor histidine kinase [bacterium]
MKNKFTSRRQTLRLAATYLAVMMLFSLVFSAAIFGIFANNLNRPMRQKDFSNEVSEEWREARRNFEKQVENRNHETLSTILISLIAFNGVILLAGAWASWLLARWTLRPIEQNMALQAQFVSDASHEIRTPLAAMLLSNEVALRKKQLTEPKSREVLAKNIEEIQKLTTLTENLLALSKNEKSKIAPSKFNSKDLILAVFEKLLPRAEAKEISLKFKGEDFAITANQAVAEQILTIFAENAIKYSPAQKEVEITARKSKKAVIFEIQDFGEGISKTDQRRIFERFYRSDSARTRGENSGYGLGLAIAQNLAERNNFQLLVESEPQKGAKFILKIPR